MCVFSIKNKLNLSLIIFPRNPGGRGGLLSWLHSLQHTFCLSDLLTKAQRLFETMADWESSSQHEFELSFHCRYYRLLKVGYVNQVIPSLSYNRIWTISKFRLLVFFERFWLRSSRSSVSRGDWPYVSKRNDCWTLLSCSVLIVFTLGLYLAQRKKKGNWFYELRM